MTKDACDVIQKEEEQAVLKQLAVWVGLHAGLSH